MSLEGVTGIACTGLAMAVAASSSLLAQAGGVDIPDGTGGMVTTAGAGATLIWFVHHCLQKLIPEMQREHRESVEKIVEVFAAEAKAQREEKDRDINRIITLCQAGISADRLRGYSPPADATRPENVR